MTQYNWSTIRNEEFARLIRNGAVKQAYDTDFNAEFIEETARRIESIAAAVQAEREACANTVIRYYGDYPEAKDIAAAIRARNGAKGEQ